MNRKKWTPNTNVTDSLLKSRDKKKWQLALRRYIVERNLCTAYAPFFGIDIENFRKWIETQFITGLTWDNFGLKWQFAHVIPLNFFDFNDNVDMKICWNFLNIKIIELDGQDGLKNTGDLILARNYFLKIQQDTGILFCRQILSKIKNIEDAAPLPSNKMLDFISLNKATLEIFIGFSQDEFVSVNKGETLENVLLERDIIKRFS